MVTHGEREIQTTLRLKEGMHWGLRELAVQNRRSMNNQLIHLIERGIAAEKSASSHTA